MKQNWIICTNSADRFDPRVDKVSAVFAVSQEDMEISAFHHYLMKNGLHAYPESRWEQFETRNPLPAPVRFSDVLAFGLKLLDELEDFRRRHQNDTHHPSDWCMRCMEAIVAGTFGYRSRNDWIEKLAAEESEGNLHISLSRKE